MNNRKALILAIISKGTIAEGEVIKLSVYGNTLLLYNDLMLLTKLKYTYVTLCRKLAKGNGAMTIVKRNKVIIIKQTHLKTKQV